MHSMSSAVTAPSMCRIGAMISSFSSTTSFGTNELIGINLSSREVDQKVRVGNAPLGFALAEEGKIALVACMEEGIVSVVDLENSHVVNAINVGGSPNSVTISPRGYRAYVTDYGHTREGSLHIIDVRERRMIATITPRWACLMLLSPMTRRMTRRASTGDKADPLMAGPPRRPSAAGHPRGRHRCRQL